MRAAVPTPTTADVLAAAVREAVTLASCPPRSAYDALLGVGAMSRRLIHALDECERAAWSREQILEGVAEARVVHAASPFVRRLQRWPRGYAGDFETVEHIVSRRNQAPDGTLARWIEQFALDSPIAEQHRNKVRLQAGALLDTAVALGGRSDEARVLILACGGAADVALVQQELNLLNVHLVLVDQDPDALAYAGHRLPMLGSRLTTVCRNVVRGLASVRTHGPFDLMLAGGLFDYLPDAVATGVLRYARERLLRPPARVFFTNIADGNPFRVWIEYLADWRLIHRSAHDVSRLCVAAGFDPADVTVSREQTGLTFVVETHAAAVRQPPWMSSWRPSAGPAEAWWAPPKGASLAPVPAAVLEAPTVPAFDAQRRPNGAP
jgi:extracellular factor (EF) 3-hydroxypalmitic acid methyl ester biosynthesis protein